MKKIILTALLTRRLAMLLFSQDHDVQWIQSPGPTAVNSSYTERYRIYSIFG